MLLKITKLPPEELDEIEWLVTHKIRFISEALLDESLLNKAEAVLSEIDPDDAPFLALAWQLDAKLWSGDKKLRAGLLNKGFSDVLNTEEVNAWLSEEET
jgi:predicted nucleic acid-binding protein